MTSFETQTASTVSSDMYWLVTLDRQTGQCWSYGPYPEHQAVKHAQLRKDRRFYAVAVKKR